MIKFPLLAGAGLSTRSRKLLGFSSLWHAVPVAGQEKYNLTSVLTSSRFAGAYVLYLTGQVHKYREWYCLFFYLWTILMLFVLHFTEGWCWIQLSADCLCSQHHILCRSKITEFWTVSSNWCLAFPWKLVIVSKGHVKNLFSTWRIFWLRLGLTLPPLPLILIRYLFLF